MAEQVQIGITLDGGQAIRDANAATAALESLNKEIKDSSREISDAKTALKRLGGETVVNADQFKKLKAAITANEKKLSTAQLDALKLGDAFKKTAPAAKGLAKGLEEFSKQSKDMGGPLGRLMGQTEHLAKFSQTGAAKYALMGGAIAAVGVAFGVAAVKAFGFASALAEARDTELRGLVGMTSMGKNVGDFEAQAKGLQAIIGKVTHASAASREEVTGIASELFKAGLRGQDLEDAISAGTKAQVVQGKEGADAFILQATALKNVKGGVKGLADDIDRKLGKEAKKAMLSDIALSKKLGENIDSMFEGLDTEPLKQAKKGFVDLFDSSTVEGAAMHAALKPMIENVQATFIKAIRKAKLFVMDWVAGTITLDNTYLRMKLSLKQFTRNWIAGWDEIKASVQSFPQSLENIGADFGKRLEDWTQKIENFGAKLNIGVWLQRAWDEFDPVQMGKSLIEGIKLGFTKGWQALRDSIVNMAAKAKAAFKEALGIHSPSREFAKAGLQIPRGVESGIKEGQRDLDRTVAGMVDPVKTQEVSNDNSRTQRTIVFSPSITIQVSGSGAAVDSLEAQLTEMLTRVAQQAGAV